MFTVIMNGPNRYPA